MSTLMHLNIKNDEAHRIALELSHLTGENLTQAVIQALAERLERERHRQREKRKGLRAELEMLAAQCVRLPILDARQTDNILYDEDGLPKRDSRQ